MVENSKIYNILISCPSDINELLEPIDAVINNFNKSYGYQNGLSLHRIHWKTDGYPEAGKSPQDSLNNQIIDKSDLAIAMFWTRFGSPTINYGSGTEEEIERMIAQGKQVFLYSFDFPVNPSHLDSEQYKKVQDFKNKHKKTSFYYQFSDKEAFLRKLPEHLVYYFENKKDAEKLESIGATKQVLWVDDIPANNQLIINYLIDLGINVDLALNTTSAQRLISQNHYSLIISDMGRRESNREGYVLLDSVKPQNIPFIIFSSDGSKPEYKYEAKKNGAYDSIDDPNELVRIIFNLLL